MSRSNAPAVYVLDEIAELASGGGENAQGLADATIKRLGNKSPIVKQKVLFNKGCKISLIHTLRCVLLCRLSD